MTKLLQRAPLFLFAPLFVLPAARAQAIPADTGTAVPGIGFSLPRVGGSVSYGISASELISTGFYNGGTSYTTNVSGDVAFVTKSPRHPFSAVYDGGVLVANSNQPTSFFQSLSFSQILNTKRWNIAIADSVSYLPQSPLGGLSGIPGVGDLGVDPVAVGPASGLGILTTYGPRVSNTTSGTVGRQITGHVSAQATGIFAIQRFIGDNSGLGISTTTEGASAGMSYHFSARDTLTGNYNYTHFSYTGSLYAFTTQGATAEYTRQWSRRLTTDVYGGPQFISGSNSALFKGTSVQFAAGASASYLARSTSYSLGYSRGVNNGSGVIPGSFSDSLSGAAHRRLGQDWDVSGNVSFARTTSLPNVTLFTFNSKGVSFGGQGSRRLGRYFSGYLSYTVQDQSTSASGLPNVAQNAFSGVYQVVGIGLTYSPRNILLGR